MNCCPISWKTIRKKGDDELYLKLEGIDTKEAATKFLRREVWLKEEEMQTHTQKNNPIGWVGYQDDGPGTGPGSHSGSD